MSNFLTKQKLKIFRFFIENRVIETHKSFKKLSSFDQTVKLGCVNTKRKVPSFSSALHASQSAKQARRATADFFKKINQFFHVHVISNEKLVFQEKKGIRL